MSRSTPSRCLLFDWGNTLMRVFPEHQGPMAGWPRVEAVPGTRGVLAELRSQWTVALATNAADSDETEIRSALDRAGLDRFIDRVYCFRGIGHHKSEPQFFERVLEDLGMARRDVVMVGDDLEGDVLTANRSGIRAIWFDERGTEDRADAMYRTIHHMRELREALGELLAETGSG